MNATNPNRQPQGQPTGGQFAAKANPESDTELADQPQPEMAIERDGTRVWRLDGHLHRDGGPAVTCPDGTEQWWQHGQLHRDGGPALSCPDGTEQWWQHGQLHRDGGPAVTRPDGTEQWWQHDMIVDPPTPRIAAL